MNARPSRLAADATTRSPASTVQATSSSADSEALVPARSGVRQTAFFQTDHRDDREFQSLGRVQRHQRDALLRLVLVIPLTNHSSFDDTIARARCCFGIASLIQALSDDDGVVRGCAAWSLGTLHATEAIGALHRAIAVESNPYAKARMCSALDSSG